MDITEVRKISKSLELSEHAIAEVSALDFDHFGLDEEEEGTPNDELGGEDNLDDATSDEPGDIIDDFLNQVMDLVAKDYEEQSAVDAVEDAVSSLIDDGSIPDIPGASDGDDVKSQWVWNALPKIKERLHAFGLEFDETDLEHYDTFTNQG